MMVAASGTPVCLLTSNGADKAGRTIVASESRAVNFIVQGMWKEGGKNELLNASSVAVGTRFSFEKGLRIE